MKFIALLLVLIFAYLFYPTYDLHLKKDVFSSEYHLQESNFLSKTRCLESAALVTKNLPYRCVKTSIWNGLFGGYTQYNPAIRETQKTLSER